MKYSLQAIRLAILSGSLLATQRVYAQIINTVAGNPLIDNRSALQTPLIRPEGVAIDAQGNVYVADYGNFVIRKIAASTGVSTIAAGGGSTFDDALPIPARSAALGLPGALAIDADGSVYFSDVTLSRVRKITPSGTVTNVAGSGQFDYSGDGGRAVLADLFAPTGLAIDRARNVLYIADTGNRVIRRIDLRSGVIETVAGNGNIGYTGDGGPARQASFTLPWGLAVDPAGNLFITDNLYDPFAQTSFAVVRKVDVNGIITTEVPRQAGLVLSKSVAINAAGQLHVADSYFYDSGIFRVGPGGTLTRIAGGADLSGFSQDDILATADHMPGINNFTFDAAGNLFITIDGLGMVRRVDAATQRVRTFAGTLGVLDGGPALDGALSYPTSIAFAPGGEYYITDINHHRIRRVSAGGVISTVAGNGLPIAVQDGSVAATSSLDSPFTVSVDRDGNLLFTEAYSFVRKLNLSTGRITTIAGQLYQRDYSGDGGPATAATFDSPYMALGDAAGNVYISDRENHCIRRVNSGGIVTRIAGQCRQPGYSGDGGSALQAQMDRPEGLAFDAAGNLLIADSGNSVVRRLNLSTGVISRVAGVGKSWGHTGDLGSPLDAQLGTPSGLAVDRIGNIFVSDEGNHSVRVVRGNVIDTVAGFGLPAFYGDGLEARFAFLNTPEAVAVDAAGNIFIADSNNNRIRRILLSTGRPASLRVSRTSMAFRVQQGAATYPEVLAIQNSGSGILTWSMDATTGTGGRWIRLSATAGSAPSFVLVTADPTGLTPGSYQATLTVRSTENPAGTVTIPVSLVVDPPSEARLSLSTGSLAFEAAQGSSSLGDSRILSVSNTGGGDLIWRAEIVLARGSGWLNLSQSSGTARPDRPNDIAVSVNPVGLGTGFYLGLITVTHASSGVTATVLVSLQVSPPAGRILLSTDSMTFTAVQGSNFIPSQSLRVLNEGQGRMQWQLRARTEQGSWLKLSTLSGESDSARPANSPEAAVEVDPGDLPPGLYGGLLLVDAADARNSPQVVSVLLRVLPAGSLPIPTVSPTGVILSGTVGSAPQRQSVALQTTGGAPLTYSAGAATSDGAGWLTVSPAQGSLLSSAELSRLQIQAAPGTLAAGIYRGSVNLTFGDGRSSEVAVVMVLRAAASASAAREQVAERRRADSGDERATSHCVPTRQVIVSTRLGNSFSIPTGWPAVLATAVTDDCGAVVANSTVSVSFSTGDTPILLTNLRDGFYTGTWVPRPPAVGPSNAVQITLRALNPGLQESNLQLTGQIAQDTTVITGLPVIVENGTVNAASFTPLQPISSGSIVTIFGRDLASAGACFGGNCATSLPLPTVLGGASVKIGGVDAPIFFAGPTQINAQVPVELNGQNSADVVVSARGIVSAAQAIQIDPTQPGIFTAGGTQGAILNENFSPNSISNPIDRGSVLQIFATGLGPTAPAVQTGETAPLTPPFATLVNPVAISIGGAAASVEFQALAPGFVGLYQINVRVPANIAPGNAVPLRITQSGITSNEVTVAIR